MSLKKLKLYIALHPLHSCTYKPIAFMYLQAYILNTTEIDEKQ